MITLTGETHNSEMADGPRLVKPDRPVLHDFSFVPNGDSGDWTATETVLEER